ncbi:MAG TPA: trehalose-phosphatase [Ktedonobacterales bacterium]|nr:trehalose-phosphatase [Ktedonobacterales bacterium]
MAIEEAFSPSDTVRDRLRAVLALRPLGLFSDIDGTLSAIAPTPDAATLLPGVADLLKQALSSFDLVAAVSGRTAIDARAMVGLPGLLYIGNHGLEHLSQDDMTVHVRPEAEPWIRAINHVLASIQAPLTGRFPGLVIERKGVTATIHLRGVEHPQEAEDAVYEAVTDSASAGGLHVTRGKMVVELRPPLAIDKGVSIEGFVRARGLRGAFYLGDDQTDIDAFRTLRRLTVDGVCQGIAVAVLHSEAPAHLAAEADMTLPSAEAAPGFLRWLLENTTAATG